MEKLKDKIEKYINKTGVIRTPAYFIKELFNDIVNIFYALCKKIENNHKETLNLIFNDYIEFILKENLIGLTKVINLYYDNPPIIKYYDEHNNLIYHDGDEGYLNGDFVSSSTNVNPLIKIIFFKHPIGIPEYFKGIHYKYLNVTKLSLMQGNKNYLFEGSVIDELVINRDINCVSNGTGMFKDSDIKNINDIKLNFTVSAISDIFVNAKNLNSNNNITILGRDGYSVNLSHIFKNSDIEKAYLDNNHFVKCSGKYSSGKGIFCNCLKLKEAFIDYKLSYTNIFDEMFENCYNLIKAETINLHVNYINTKLNFNKTFNGCYNLKDLKISGIHYCNLDLYDTIIEPESINYIIENCYKNTYAQYKSVIKLNSFCYNEWSNIEVNPKFNEVKERADLYNVMISTEKPHGGIHIIDIYGRFINNDAIPYINDELILGIYISDGTHDFIMHTSNIDGAFRVGDVVNTNVPLATTLAEAVLDKNGSENTDIIYQYYLENHINDEHYDRLAENLCKNFTFKNGNTGYLGSVGEWKIIIDNKDTINQCLNALGKSSLDLSGDQCYIASTNYSEDQHWGIFPQTRTIEPVNASYDSSRKVIPFTTY